MTCRFTNSHALGEGGCFSPRDFEALVAREHKWLGLLLYLTRRRALGCKGFEREIITAMMSDRAR